MKTEIYKLTLGTPEKFVPSRFAPAQKVPVREISAKDAPEIKFSVSRRGCRIVFPLSQTARIYGFGLQLKAFNHRGNKITCRVNADPRSASGDSHAPVPFFVTDEGWGMYVDTARNAVFQCGSELNTGSAANEPENGESRVMNSTGELYAVRTSASSVMTIEIPAAEGVDLYFFRGERIVDIVSAYNMLSGGGCMPPMWGLGNFYRCCGQFGEDQVLETAAQFRSLALPCDILGLEPGWQSRSYSCSYVWSERFPHHREMLKKLTGQGFHVNLWEHAFVNPASPVHDSLVPYSGDYLVWNGLVPDFSLDEASDIFAGYHKELCDDGITGFKLDECDGSDFTGGWSFPDCAAFPSGMDGEQYHHLFGTLYCRTIMKALGEKRTLSEVRNMGALAASYPFVLYSDLYDFGDFLTGTVNAGFSGLLWAPELRHAESSDELIRRLQLTAFSAQSLVNAWYLDKMPWLDINATDAVREIFETRMRFLPYLYTAFCDYHKNGKPPVRALVCDYPDAADISDEYLFGDILVAPIAPGETGRTVKLPEGEWYGFFDGKRCSGGEHYTETAGVPLYVRAGTIIPVAEPVQCVSPDTVFDITLRAFGDCTDAVCRLADDGGLTDKAACRVITLRLGKGTVTAGRYRITGGAVSDTV